MKQRPIACASLLALSLGAVGASQVRTADLQDDLQKAIQAKLTEVRDAAGYPGLTAAVAMPDGRVISAATGWGDTAREMPMSSLTRMPAASVGKTFVAAAILQAVDDGKLDLDIPIERSIGREPWFTRLPNAKALTLRLLLSHRSGVPEVYENDAFVKAVTADPERTWRPTDLLAFVFDKKPRSRAGTRFLYTDMNYVIAGVVFEEAVGRPLFAEIERRLLMPLRLDATVPLERKDWRDVVPGLLDPKNPFFAVTAPEGETMRNGRFLFGVQAEYAGGGLISSPRDLVRWAKALWEGRVFSAARLAEMLDAQPSAGGDRYGLDVGISQSGAGPVYGHDGWAPGYQTVVVYFADFKLAAAIQINSDPMKRYKVRPGDCLGEIVSIPIQQLRKRTRP